MVVVDEADNGQESLEKIKTIDCNLVILDISMPGTNCFDLIKDIRVLKPKLPILIVTMHPEDQYALRLFKAGVSGYLTKEKAPTELLEAIRLVASGRMNVPSSVAEQAILGWRQESEKQSHENLSNREYQIMHMIVSGQKVGTIAKTLSISVKTVKTHRSRLLAKMNMSTNAELFHYAIKHNLVDDISV